MNIGRKIMAIVIEDIQVESLAKQLAVAEGISVTEVLRESLQSLAGVRGPRKASLRERLAALAREVDNMPSRVSPDHRSDNEIFGYNEHGTW
jgi:hypothetical protein